MSQHDWFTNKFSEEVWQAKYAGNYSDVYTYFSNLAELVSAGDEDLANKFFDMMWHKRFAPGGRILAGAGRNGAMVSWMNCTTHQVEEDTLEGIGEAVYKVMKASSRGQGIGVDLSLLRPRGSTVNNSAITSTGAISFMELINHAGGIIGQEGRRAALLFSINDNHPDLWRPGELDVECNVCKGAGCLKCDSRGYYPYDFLHVKRIPGKVTNANISVNLSRKFMEAVKNDQDWVLEFESESTAGKEKHYRLVKARYLFRAIAASAHASAEPGVLFIDTTRTLSNSDIFGKEWAVTGVNACTEQLLDQEGVCNLGSMNLGAYVVGPFTREAWFNYQAFYRDVQTAIIFLDNVLDIELKKSVHISDKQRRSIQMLRRLGLGVMGLADAMAMLGLPYTTESEETEEFVKGVFGTLRNASYQASINLAINKGSAGVFEGLSKEDRKTVVDQGFYKTLPNNIRAGIYDHGLRNVTLLSVAPTGSISNLLGVSSGIEPLFALEYIRRYRLNGHDEFVDYVHPAVVQSRRAGVPDDVWNTAYQVSPEEHIRIQALAQRYIDQSISKTTNLPGSATVDDVMHIYSLAHELGLKGLAVYVDGSRDQQILHEKDECPICLEKGNVVHKEGCKECTVCGWSVCLT